LMVRLVLFAQSSPCSENDAGMQVNKKYNITSSTPSIW
jgi:hypothetical protein